MNALRALLLVFACVVVGACVSADYGAGHCSSSEWTRLDNPPSRAPEYQRIADENTAFGGRFSYWREYWFSRADGATMLCRLGDGNERGQGWVFLEDGAYVEDESFLWIMSD